MPIWRPCSSDLRLASAMISSSVGISNLPLNCCGRSAKSCTARSFLISRNVKSEAKKPASAAPSMTAVRLREANSGRLATSVVAIRFGSWRADATDRSRLAHVGGMRRAVDIDIAAHRVGLAEPVAARLAAREPQDAGQDPVAPRIAGMERRRPQLAGRPAPHEHRVVRLAGADLGAHDVAAARRAEAAVFLAQAVLRR